MYSNHKLNVILFLFDLVYFFEGLCRPSIGTSITDNTCFIWT